MKVGLCLCTCSTYKMLELSSPFQRLETSPSRNRVGGKKAETKVHLVNDEREPKGLAGSKQPCEDASRPRDRPMVLTDPYAEVLPVG